MDLINIIFRSLISISFLFLMTKLLGHRQISQLNFFDYVIGISMGSIAAEMAINTEYIYLHGFLSMGVYTLVAVFSNYITIKSNFIRKMINGTPIILIDNGVLIKENMKKGLIEVNELLTEARIAGYFNITEIAYAIMENNGKISFLPYEKYQTPTCKDLNIKKFHNKLPITLIIDKKILKDNLLKINKTEQWIYNELKKQKYELNNVLLGLYIDDKLVIVKQK